MPRRRIRPPVLSRLSVAWIAFGVTLALVAVGATAVEDEDRSRVALAVGALETLAPPPSPTKSDPPERLGPGAKALAPSLVSADIDGERAFDELDYATDGAPPAASLSSAEVVITIDGAPAKSAAERRIAVEAARRIALAQIDPGLRKPSAHGPVPRIADDGRRVASIYARPFQRADAPVVGLIVGGLGLNRELTERAINELPAEITLAFAPYAKDLEIWTQRARAAGHEIMIELPMEDGAGDPAALGAAALLTSRSAEENATRLDWLLSRFDGYFGATNYLGGKFAGNRVLMGSVLARLQAAGVAYVDDTDAMQWLDTQGLPDYRTVSRFVSPGYNDTLDQTRRDLEALEALARREGEALGKTYANPAAIDELRGWAASLDARGLSLGPASALMQKNPTRSL